MILKRTKSIKQPAAAMSWVGEYVDEVRKHAGQDLGHIGLGIGHKYYSTRPPGLLTAHGYICGQVDELRRQTPPEAGDRTGVVRNNRAVHEFVRRHCRAQREKKRRVIALRLVASLDPDKVEAIVRYRIDLDRLLIAAIERTLSRVAEKHYPGDELGYIVGLHHDALDKFQRPHLHAHIFLLPQTRSGVLISLSNHSRPGRDGKYVDMLSEATELFQAATMDLVYSTPPARYKSFATQEWDDLVKEISVKTVEVVTSGRDMTRERKRAYAIDAFFFHVRKTRADWLGRRLGKLKAKIAELKDRGRSALIAEARWLFDGLEELIRPFLEERRQITRQILPEFQKQRVSCEVSECQLKETRTCLAHWRTVGSRRKLIEDLLEEVANRRMAARINILSELGLIDLHLAAAGLTVNPPGWIQRLEVCVRNDKLPNKDLVEQSETPPEVAPGASGISPPLVQPVTPVPPSARSAKSPRPDPDPKASQLRRLNQLLG